MRANRREVLGLVMLPALSACGSQGSSASSRGGSQASSAALPIMDTPLGQIQIEGVSGQEWAGLAHAAAAQVAKLWGRTERTLRVVICATDEQFETSAAGLTDVTAAVTTPHAIYLGPSVTRSLTEVGRRVVLAHELTHARLAHYGADRTALWVKEGAAEWTADSGVKLSRKQLWPTLAGETPENRPSGPPGTAEFTRQPALAYETSAAYANYLVEMRGRQFFQNLVRSRPNEAVAQRDIEGLTAGRETFTVWLNSTLSRS